MKSLWTLGIGPQYLTSFQLIHHQATSITLFAPTGPSAPEIEVLVWAYRSSKRTVSNIRSKIKATENSVKFAKYCCSSRRNDSSTELFMIDTQ